MVKTEEILEQIKSGRDYVTQRPSGDHLAVNVPQEEFLGFMKTLRDDFGMDMLVDGTAIDWGLEAEKRYTVVYHLLNSQKHFYIRVCSDCADNDFPISPSVAGIWPAADWHEREAYDMFGIKFEGHPNMTRILMWEGYGHHPLRRDFPLAGVETDLPADDVAKATEAKVIAAPMMGGPFRSPCGDSMKYREPMARDESWTEKNEKPLTEG